VWSVAGAAKSRTALITPASLPTDLPDITQLFRAYAASLPIDLGYQGFDGELASLPGKYAPPAGALLIARDANGAALGCVAMRPLDPSPPGEGVSLRAAEADGRGGSAEGGKQQRQHPSRREASFATPSLEREGWSFCEMKRLYVAPAGRGQGLGKQLARAIIEAARAAGHHEMRLDTLASMHDAQALYRALGFVEIAPYYDTPIEGTVFMSLAL
jgi:ribosomal protein S18 acetylase RimI-like enzyme